MHPTKGIYLVSLRGIDVVRGKIKEFAETKVKLPQDAHKMVILDESDSLTAAAQQALRMIISDYSNSTRFMFACNDSSRLIEPIQSRCVILRFNRLTEEEILERLIEIAKLENIPYDEEGMKALVFAADGDMRNAINNLQATAVAAKRITQEKVFEICDIPDLGTLKVIVESCIKADYERAFDNMNHLWSQSFTAYDLINSIGKVIEIVISDTDLLYSYLDEVANLKVKVLQGLNSLIQLQGFLARLCDISRGLQNKHAPKAQGR